MSTLTKTLLFKKRALSTISSTSTLINTTTTAANSWSAWRDKYELVFAKPLNVFASCLPGLESILHHEITHIHNTRHPAVKDPNNTHGSKLELESGGVSFQVSSLSQILATHLYLGSASHIFIRCGNAFVATDLDMLTQQVTRMSFWTFYFPLSKDFHLDIRVVTTKSRLNHNHTHGIIKCVEKGIQRALLLGQPHKYTPTITHDDDDDKDTPAAVKILVRIHQDQVLISIDSSNTPLHRRGYRLETGKAPLREDIAFALLYTSLVVQKHLPVVVVDPFCGSGTIVIEAAAMILNIPPGRLRSSPLTPSRLLPTGQAWNDFVTLALNHNNNNNNNNYKSDSSQKPTAVIMGSDRDRGVIDVAWNNAIRAGIQPFVHFQHCAISDNPYLQLVYEKQQSSSNTKDGNILVATNPPFGLRISHVSSTTLSRKKKYIHPLLPLYQTLGKLINVMNYNACILAHDITLARRTGIPHLTVAFTTKHGGLSVSALSTTACRQ
jgi:putative N6-adenine-specific DNA methylase